MIAGEFSGRSPRFTLLDRWMARFRPHDAVSQRSHRGSSPHPSHVVFIAVRGAARQPSFLRYLHRKCREEGELIPSQEEPVAKTRQRVLAVRSEAKRDLGPAHHDAAIEKRDHAGLDSSRPVVAEHSSRCDHVAAFPEND